jgi:hypothetical protein
MVLPQLSFAALQRSREQRGGLVEFALDMKDTWRCKGFNVSTRA